MDTLGEEAEREYDENQRSIDSMRDAAGPGKAVLNLELPAAGAGSAVAPAAQLTAASQSPSAPAAALLGLVSDGASELAVAQQAKSAADKNASAMLDNLKQYITRTRSYSGDADQAALALRIEKTAKQETSKKVFAAEAEYKSRLAALKTAQADQVDQAAKAANMAARQLFQARTAESRAMRQHVDEMERASKAQLKQLGKATKEAAHTARRAAKRLMRAERESGVSERQAEADYSRSEHFYDDFGEHLRENTGDLVEHFYQAVGHRVEARMDTLGD